MIIAKIFGGLGNQLFQYTLGRALAIKHNAQLKLDTSFFMQENVQYTTYRKFGLDSFCISADIATEEEINFIKRSHLKGLYKSFYWRLQYIKPYFKQNHIKEKSFTYDLNIMNCPNNVYLDGYWQSPKYFEGSRNILLEELSLKVPIIDEIENNILKNIKNNNSVSIHIRRGDYITKSEHLDIYNQIGIEYYNKAMQFIESKIEAPLYFIFSDDLVWAIENFKQKNIHFVEIENAPTSMYLMSQCRHNIIANSTFSWWGAWLNNNSNSIIITPKKWFLTSRLNTQDLIPESWIQL